MAVGSICEDEFRDLAFKMAKFSAQIRDTWTLKVCPGNGQEIYLEKNCIITEKKDAQNQDSTGDVSVGKKEYPEENLEAVYESSCLQGSCLENSDFVSFKYHIIYSHSYSVPALYFSACRSDGKLLTLEELWRRAPTQYQHTLNDNKWAMLTQQEHPYLGSPFFLLHPCHTVSLMSRVPSAEDKRYYLIKWLSTFGPVVGLELSPLYATAFDLSDNT